MGAARGFIGAVMTSRLLSWQYGKLKKVLAIKCNAKCVFFHSIGIVARKLLENESFRHHVNNCLLVIIVW